LTSGRHVLFRACNRGLFRYVRLFRDYIALEYDQSAAHGLL
jgi:hypothetical protein